MSVDRRRLATTAPQKPLTPRLAASSAGQARASPAPKLAGYASPSSASSASRRPLSANVSELNINAKPGDGDHGSGKGTNVTPRSSARKSRADTTESTPTQPLDDTPTSHRPASIVGVANVGRSRQPLTEEKPASEQSRLSSPTSFALRVQQGQGYPLSPSSASSEAQLTTDDKDSYFFRANDAHKDAKATRPLLHKPGGSFVYANGLEEQTAKPASQATSPVSSRPVSFARSDSAPAAETLLPAAPALFNSPARPILSPSPQAVTNGIRAASPPRPGFHLSYRKGVSQIIRPSPLSPNPGDTHRRRSSIDGVDDDRRPGRAMSVSSTDSGPTSKRDHGLSLLHAFHVPSHKMSPAVSPTGPILEDDEPEDAQPGPDHLQSPPDTADSTDGTHTLNDAAASARRERKILDLQISNSSLLAINKSLEREVRKQKGELRRLRRLSRLATRESLLSHASEGRESQASIQADPDLDSSDLNAALDDDDSLSSTSDSYEDDAASPGGGAGAGTQAQRDQRRLVADLQAHKALLADSQRLNGALGRCLGVTEQLIRDGARALAYCVPLDDVRLGGRVLSPEETEDLSFVVEERPGGESVDLAVDGDTVEPAPHDPDSEDARRERQQGIVQDVLASADALHGGVGQTF